MTEVWRAARQRCPQIGYMPKGAIDQEKPQVPRAGEARQPWDRRGNRALAFGGRQAQGEQLTLARNTKATKCALLVGYDA